MTHPNEAAHTQIARLFRVYLPGALKTETFTSAAGLDVLERRGLIRRLGTTYRNHGGQTGAGARRGVRVTYQNVTQTEEGRRVVGALIALFRSEGSARLDASTDRDCELASSGIVRES